MHPTTLKNAAVTARLVGHEVYIKQHGKINISMTDTAPKPPYTVVDPAGNVTEAK